MDFRQQPFYGNYNFGQMQMQPQAQPVQNNQALNWVQGEAGAKSWIVGRGETALLMDSEKQVFYIKSCDATGMPLPLRVFDYTERKQEMRTDMPIQKENPEYVTREEYTLLANKFNDLESLIEQMGKPKAKKKEASDE